MEASQELVDAFGRLPPQLSSTADPLGYEAIDRMVTCDANTVLVARTSNESVSSDSGLGLSGEAVRRYAGEWTVVRERRRSDARSAIA
ncbi:hypothetical protein ACGFY3_01725 [Streptomyces mirabilis]|uniref:hypothetical protein n=1 Tax=Streptomyces mirabilis TaxID=68239 RepID=UPI0037237355